MECESRRSVSRKGVRVEGSVGREGVLVEKRE